MSPPAVFVTGAADGIGRATARLFAQRGWFVGAYGLGDVDALARELGPQRCRAGHLDVTDAAAFAAALQQFAAAAGGRLDLLFNCAGLLSVGPFEDTPLARHHALVEANFKGVLNGCHAALPLLRATPGSRVINMASASAIHGTPDYASYSATKFAVRGFTEALSIEWQRHGIRVMDVLPLFVRTAMVTDIAQPVSIRRLGVRLEADDVAQTVWRAAHYRGRWSRVHWHPSWQGRLLALGDKLSPFRLNRYTIRKLSGY